MKLFITGGHVTPAIAVIEEIRDKHPDWEILFIGRKHALEGGKDISAEYRTITEMGITFFPINAGRLTRSFTMHTILSLFKSILGFIESLRLVGAHRPNKIISFGGYVALPVVIAGWLFGIPSLTHEQTTTIGLSNKLMLPFVKKLCISFSQTRDEYPLPKEKTVITGLPLRKELFGKTKPLFSISEKYPVIYVAGGATGSESINSIIFRNLTELLGKYTIIHQTGFLSWENARKKIDTLANDEKKRYFIRQYFSASELAWIYRVSDLYVGRSGANTVGELAAIAKVAVFIPLPWAASGEQLKNAKVLESAGSSVILPQEEAENLLSVVARVLKSRESMQRKAEIFSKMIPHDAASRIVDEIESLQ